MSTTQQSCETTYEIAVRHNGVFVTFNSGYLISEYRTQENIHRPLDYLANLIKMEYRGKIEIYLGSGTSRTFITGLYSKTHPHSGVPLSDSLFRFGELFVPVSNREYILKFIQDLTSAMVEYKGISGTQSLSSYTLPRATLSVQQTGVIIEISLPGVDGLNKSHQAVTFTGMELIGMRDMLVLVRTRGHVSRVGGATFVNSIAVSSSGEGYIYRSTLYGKNGPTTKDIYLDKCHIAPLIKELETAFVGNEKFISEIFSGTLPVTALWCTGEDLFSALTNPYAKPKEEVKVEVKPVPEPETKPKEEIKVETKPVPKPEIGMKGEMAIELGMMDNYDSVIEKLNYPLTVPKSCVPILGSGDILGPSHMRSCLVTRAVPVRAAVVLGVLVAQTIEATKPKNN